MVTLLVLLSLLLTLGGLIATSQATFGVGIICAGAVFAILARITQAANHHEALMAAARKTDSAVPVVTEGPDHGD